MHSLESSKTQISIHDPRVGADKKTPEVRLPKIISIHDPRVGADPNIAGCPHIDCYFNPRPPCGGRQGPEAHEQFIQEFQSTTPVWGPTSREMIRRTSSALFQSTTPVWGPTKTHLLSHSTKIFQSTTPVWGPTANVDKNAAAFLCICAIFLHF